MLWILQVEFLRPVTVSILSERRALPPFGLQGGQPGARGLNLLLRRNGVVNLGSKSSVTVEARDRLRLLTPGAAFLSVLRLGLGAKSQQTMPSQNTLAIQIDFMSYISRFPQAPRFQLFGVICRT